MVEQTDIRVVRCGGSKICFSTPILTNDSRFLICASGDSVKVFSTRTEECVHVLHGHANQVTGVALNPANHLQVYSCSLDGTVRLWDFIDGILIKTFTVGYKISSIYVSNKHIGVIFIILPMQSNENGEHFQLVAVRLPSALEQELEARELSAVLSDVSPVPACTAFGQGGDYIASAKGLQLCVYFFRKQKTYRFKLKATDKKGARNAFTCVACHPKDDCIATGHQDGKIRLWRNFNQKKEYTYSTQHWHHNAVSALCFSPEGMHLLSGGVESVLVQWHCKEVNKKNFLPRLGGAIAHICVSPDGQMYSTSHTNNKITIISSFRVSAVIQGLVKGGSVQTDLMIDPRTKALVLNGKPGHLQFYSLERDKQLYSLDIVQQEYIYQAGLDQFEVVKAALDGTASWLATVEQRGSKISSLEFSLKLWSFNEKAQSFELNTTITAPHQNMITAMCFSPAMDTTMLVTVAKDDQFKVWLLGSDLDEQKKQASWSCEHLGSYHGLQPTNCCFSGDGSLLAVSFAEVVTLWSPDTWELLTTLCQPPGTIEDLCFGRLSCSKYLLGTTTKNLLCWNLLTCALEWSTSMDVCVLRTDPLSENVAAFCHNSGKTDLFVFRPSEPRPLFTQKAVCVGRVQRCIFVPREDPLDSCDEWSQWLNRSRLHFLTEQMELLTFSTRAEDERILNSRKELLVDDSVAMTPFYLLLGKHRQQQQEKQTSVPSQAADRAQLPQGCVAIRELLHTPAHVLPPASFLCSVFLNSLLISNTGGRDEKELPEQEVDSEKEEVDSEEEMEMNNGPQGVRTQGSVGEAPPSLSRAEEKELRRLRKTDFSWVTSLTSS
ncbi:WD repeat-containing protein 75 [Electrophorus electricus]|uniref:WD repeat-containing protein 75 second beta-propeller domain-containing protein n=1 Tax=Electrophorus electricus TaxID=8005 RepID=A0A4W4HDE5_ELEEL|nr:WD repeat-containing protein 75 [Electrophorus electricus]